MTNLQEVFIRHRETEGGIERPEIILRHCSEAFDGLHIVRRRIVLRERLRLFLRALSGVDGVNAEMFDRFDFLRAEFSGEHIGRRRPDDRRRILVNQLHALHRGIRALVKLSRQILRGKNGIARFLRKCFLVELIERRLGKDGAARLRKGLVVQIFDVIANQHAHTRDIGNAEIGLDVLKQFYRAHGIRFLLLYIDSSNAHF